mmetsp:Transcript_33393/g.77551  ORF Transcript_33393/g.77551 Transcript_33393/m.77551 type:complete len:207 (-) Transcript_33393:690-1310(-)
MAFEGVGDTHGPAHIGVDIAAVVVVVAAKVVLHALSAVDEEVVVRVEVGAAVVVVYALLWRVVVDEKVVVKLAPGHDHRRLAGPDAGEEWLPVPGIEWPMVSRLTASGEDEVVADHISTAKAIVGVDARSGPVEEDVAINGALCCLGLDVEAVLLLVESDLADEVAQDAVPTRVVPVGAVNTRLREVRVRPVVWEAAVLGLVGVAP